jgi:1-acyl-sn-glycerol-3-phosphate acyltransferase
MVTQRLVTVWLRVMLHFLCRIDAAQLARVPRQGPLILAANHVNFLDVPVLFTQLMPRPLWVLAKAETWDNPAIGWLFDVMGGGRNAIPLRRGEADIDALRQALAALEQGGIMCVAPEGTRSGNGCLQRGQPGVVMLALHSRAPILPMVYFGGERLRNNLRGLRRTDFHICVGNPFYLEASSRRVTHEIRQQMVDEIMWQMAALLPSEYRGAYADLGAATGNFLRFPEGSASNLRPRP